MSGESFGRVRYKVTRQLELPIFAPLLWELFKTLIYGIPDGLKGEVSSEVVELIKEKPSIDISEFLNRALKLDDGSLQ